MSHIIVGCGGSGAKSAQRLAALMAQHPYWRANMEDSVFFLLVDTDEGELSESEERIRRVAPSGTFVQTLNTTRGFSSAYELVDEFMEAVRRSDPPAAKRFVEHWWTQNWREVAAGGEPLVFTPDLTEITAGAGQVPMVSFMAAWYAMKSNRRSKGDSVEGAINRLIEEIGNRKAHQKVSAGSPLDRSNVTFIGSVAGGTGRGCALPIAFKMKEMFHQRFDKGATIVGFFLNDDCFEQDLVGQNLLPVMMNSMTGWSELSTWVDLGHHRSAPPKYRLPGLERPDQEDYDALGATEGGRDIQRPFDYIGIICRTSGSGFTAEKSAHIYEMLAGCIYMDITSSDVASVRSNYQGERKRFISAGSSVIDLDFEGIRGFFVKKARLDAATGLSLKLQPHQLRNEASSLLALLGFGDAALDEFLKPTDDPKTPIQILAKELAADKGGVSDRLRKVVTAMEEQDAGQAEQELRRALSAEALDEMARDIGARFTRILATLMAQAASGESERTVHGIAGVVGEVLDRLIGERDDSLLNRYRSVLAVAEVGAEVRNRLTAMVEANGSLSDEAVAAWQIRSGRSNAFAVLEAASKRDGLLGFGKRFKQEEIEEVRRAALDELMCLCVRALGRALNGTFVADDPQQGLGLFRALGARLDQLSANAKLIKDCMSDVLRDRKLSAEDVGKEQEKLFADKDRLERSIPTTVASDDTTYHLKRRIQPIMPESESLHLQASELLKQARHLLQRPAARRDTEPDEIVRPLSVALGGVRYLFRYNDPTADGNSTGQHVPVIEAFTLQNVLRDLSRRWPTFLTALRRENPERFDDVSQAFTRFFGVGLVISDDKVTLDSQSLRDVAGKDFLMLGMASIAARTCSPFWRTGGASGNQARKVMLQIPVSIENSTVTSWENVIRDNANLNGGSVKLISNPAGSDGFNPYVLIVYAGSGVQSLDDVKSIDSWSRNPTLRNALRLAESTDTLMPWQKGMWTGYSGSGYTDPAYVLNRDLASRRWRPWHEGVVEGSEDSLKMTLALIYGWAGPEWFLRRALSGDQRLGTSPLGPVFKFGSHASICIRRSPVKFKHWEQTGKSGVEISANALLGCREPAMQRPLPTLDTTVGKSLDEVLDALGPHADPDGELKNFRAALVDEYDSFFNEIGDPAGFNPEHDRQGYSDLLDELVNYIEERRSGTLNDPEHPLVRGLTSDDVNSDSAMRFLNEMDKALKAVRTSLAGKA
jgi:hypothetical protein